MSDVLLKLLESVPYMFFGMFLAMGVAGWLLNRRERKAEAVERAFSRDDLDEDLRRAIKELGRRGECKIGGGDK